MSTEQSNNLSEPLQRHRGAHHSAGAPAADGFYPMLKTQRFSFRRFRLADIEPLAALAGEHRVADTTIGVPHPYTTDFARMWISSHAAAWQDRRALHWAAIKIGDQRIVGYAGLNPIDSQRAQAQLRFWVGRGVERKSDAVEWSERIIDFALTELNLRRVYALQLERHPLAGHVLAAIGMQPEALVRKRIYKGGLVEDFVCWAIVRNDS
jgi:[ribosomal protein S5]-alanine N-acetyltransferase